MIENFIQDYRKLFMDSPQCGSWTRASENCDYGDITTVSKDCYMCFNSGNCQNAYHCHDCRAMTDCLDCAFCEDCELCCECVDCNKCYGSVSSQDCTNCNDVYFSYDLRRCQNCFGCVGLRDGQYFVFNEKHSKEDYERIIGELVGKPDEVFKKLETLQLKTPRMFVHQYDTTNCTGDYVYHSKNCHMCFDTRHTEDSGYITQANLDMGTRDSYDCGPIPTGMDLCYDAAYSHFLFNCKHIYWCGHLKDCQWCTNCFESENLFGCHYVQTKQEGFWVLNEKVSEETYRRIVTEVGELLKEKGIYTLHDLLRKDLSESPVGSGKIEVGDDVVDRSCVLCGGEFYLIPEEIKFYKEKKIVLPVYCPNCRADQRFHLRNERRMYKRICDGCGEVLITTYPPESEHIVHCLDCYWKYMG